MFVFSFQEQSMMKPRVDALVIVGLTVVLTANVHATKILLFPSNINSHVRYFSRLAVDLAKLSNTVTVIVPSNARVPEFVNDKIENFTFLKYPVEKSIPITNLPETTTVMINMAMTTSPIQRVITLGQFVENIAREGEQDCMRLLDNIPMMRQIQETAYEFAIMDAIGAIACYNTIPYSLGIPYATLSGYVPSAYLFRVPRFFPNTISGSDRQTFLERLTTFIADFIIFSYMLPDTTYYMEKYAPNRPCIDMLELQHRRSLWFFLEDLSLNYPLPQMPNTIAVGDVMVGAKERPLSGEIKEFVSRSKHGVIIVSFGSYCEFFPPAINRRLCEAFTEATRRFGLSVIWKLKTEGFCQNDHILTLPWIPQYDLLAHPKVKLFLSHGGFNSVIESVYHSKPLIILPLAIDQPGNAAAAESKGYAIQMKITDFTSESLVSNIHKLLTDPSYKHNISLASAILRDRRDTPAQRVSAMIDHVVRYGDRHLRTGAFELSALQFMMFDIFAVFVAAAVFLFSVVTLFCCCVYRTCFRRCTSSQNELKKYKSQ